MIFHTCYVGSESSIKASIDSMVMVVQQYDSRVEVGSNIFQVDLMNALVHKTTQGAAYYHVLLWEPLLSTIPDGSNEALLINLIKLLDIAVTKFRETS